MLFYRAALPLSRKTLMGRWGDVPGAGRERCFIRLLAVLPGAAGRDGRVRGGCGLLFIGDDWAEGVRHEVAWCE
jgi:hypothetical protein